MQIIKTDGPAFSVFFYAIQQEAGLISGKHSKLSTYAKDD